MGNCNFKAEAEKDSHQAINKNHFHFQYVIGRGGFGKVWKVELRKQRKLYAMKEMAKARIISKRSVNSVMNEKKFLAMLNHQYLVNMKYAFEDRDNLYLVIDLMSGGDLRYHIGKYRRFSEEQTKFFMACILLCLEYLHKNCILHRDIKPENLVFDENGYLRITDLGIARVWNPENAKDTSGTPGYMAPEVMCRQNHGVAVDYFAMGVIAYECMHGKRPYQGKDRKEIRDHILSKQVSIKKQDIPQGWSKEAADFINKLIQRKPASRLGLNGPEEVKDHVWFRDYPWDQLLAKKLPSPFIPPQQEDNFDAKYTNSEWKDANSEQMLQHQQQLKRPSVQKLFSGYYHDEQIAAQLLKDGPQALGLDNEKQAPAQSAGAGNGMQSGQGLRNNQSIDGSATVGRSLNSSQADKSGTKGSRAQQYAMSSSTPNTNNLNYNSASAGNSAGHSANNSGVYSAYHKQSSKHVSNVSEQMYPPNIGQMQQQQQQQQRSGAFSNFGLGQTQAQGKNQNEAEYFSRI